jgi:hypothetical protein
MPETLLSPTGILLYGRVLQDLTFNPDIVSDARTGNTAEDGEPPRRGRYRFLQGQLAEADARIARIYGFAYEGHYYDLARPALFIVHGNGDVADEPVGADDRASKAPDVTGKFGVAATAKSFPNDMRVWAYDKGDFSVRLNVETGSLEQILLEAELSSDVLKTFFGGQKTRLRGPRSDED